MTDRDEQGRFVAGNKASKGGVTRAKKNEYAALFFEEINLNDFRKIIQKARRQALLGDRHARQWLAEYMVGKPPQILELRAGEAALLRELLDAFERQGVPASDVFNEMLALIAEESSVVTEVEEDED